MAEDPVEPSTEGIASMTVAGFKSIAEEQTIEFRPLTLLAGTNSSGKSSMMQPLLLLKQTLEAQYDPGPLLLFGPNAKFSSGDQLFSRSTHGKHTNKFRVRLETNDGSSTEVFFQKKVGENIELVQMLCRNASEHEQDLRPGLMHEQIEKQIGDDYFLSKLLKEKMPLHLSIARNRCFLGIAVRLNADAPNPAIIDESPGLITVRTAINNVIHLPGLRNNPTRSYPMTAVGESFP